MVLVPELHDSWVRDSRLDEPTWARPVGGKHRLPDNEHSKMFRVILLQDLFCRGSPPQARRSSRREEQQDTLVIGGAIKLLDKLGEVALVENGQLAPPAGPQKYQPTNSVAITAASAGAFLIFAVSMSHRASTLAIICGKRMTTRTIAVATHSMAMLNGLRFLHWLRPRYS